MSHLSGLGSPPCSLSRRHIQPQHEAHIDILMLISKNPALHERVTVGCFHANKLFNMLKLIILCCVTDVPEAADAYQVDCRVLDLDLIMHFLTPARRCFVTTREKWCKILGADALEAQAEQLFV